MTPNQLDLARRIATAYTNDAGGSPTNAAGTHGWISEVVSTPADKGTLTSMVNAGLAVVWGSAGKHDAATCRLTDAGWDALQAASAKPAPSKPDVNLGVFNRKERAAIEAAAQVQKQGGNGADALRQALRPGSMFRSHLRAMVTIAAAR
jgi:hypothetical protein